MFRSLGYNWTTLVLLLLTCCNEPTRAVDDLAVESESKEDAKDASTGAEDDEKVEGVIDASFRNILTCILLLALPS